MFNRNKLEEWYEGKKTECDISECGMVDTINFIQLLEFDKLRKINDILDYGNSNGDDYLIDTISRIYNCNHENILITNGASEAMFIVLLALCDGHSKVTCQFPYYNNLEVFLKKIGCAVNRFELIADSHFKFDFEKFKRVFNDDSDIAILNFPNNPTGSELNDNNYADIIKYSEFFHKIIIFDEVTALSVGKTYIEENICNHLNNCICINSMSKAYGIPGLRVGWIVANKMIIKECRAIKELISICTPLLLQKIALNTLKYRDFIINKNKQIVTRNIYSLTKQFNCCNSFFTINCIPKYCSCCFVKIPDTIKSYEFCSKLYEISKVLITPGECFGVEGYLRLGLGINPSSFDISMNKIMTFINMYYKL